MPELPTFLTRDSARADHGTKDLRQGFSVDVWVRLDALRPEQVLLDNRTATGCGFCLQTTARGTLEIVLNDGRTENRWDCDPGVLHANALHHVVVVVDGGPKVITFIVDGKLHDGGDYRQFGWGRFNPHLRGAHGTDKLRIAPSVVGLRLYDRSLRTSEAIGNFQADDCS
jgi:hypothetical protein